MVHTLTNKSCIPCTLNAQIFARVVQKYSYKNATWGELYFADAGEQSNNPVLANLGYLLRTCWWFVAGSKCLKDYASIVVFMIRQCVKFYTVKNVATYSVFVHVCQVIACSVLQCRQFNEHWRISRKWLHSEHVWHMFHLSYASYSVLRTKPTTRGWEFRSKRRAKVRWSTIARGCKSPV